MANRIRMKGVKASRKIGHRPKYNKKSVAYRKSLKRLKARKRCPDCIFDILGMNQREGRCGGCKNFSNFKRREQCNLK